jgi:hypothetical protein
MDFAKIITRFGFSEQEAVIIANDWNVSEKSFPGRHNIYFLKDEFIRKYSDLANIKPEHLDEIFHSEVLLESDAAVIRLLWHYYHLLYRAENKITTDQLPAVKCLKADASGCFYLLLAMAAYPDAVDLYLRKGYPQNVLKDTLSDMSVWIEHFKNQRGFAGITARILGWLQGHIHGETFRLGRLQFKPDLKFYDRVEVYRNTKNGRTLALSVAGIKYNRQGLLYEPEIDHCECCGTWISTLQHTASSVTGNPVNPDGYAKSEPITLDTGEWKQVLAGGDPVIDIHIPAIGPMTVEACADSVNQAVVFMRNFFPELNHRAFSCESWLLDNQFEQILSHDSNIILFQRAGYIYPFPHKSEAVPRIFGEKADNLKLDLLPQNSSLQRAAAGFLNKGGVFRNGGMFLLLEDLPWGSNPYRIR